MADGVQQALAAFNVSKPTKKLEALVAKAFARAWPDRAPQGAAMLVAESLAEELHADINFSWDDVEISAADALYIGAALLRAASAAEAEAVIARIIGDIQAMIQARRSAEPDANPSPIVQRPRRERAQQAVRQLARVAAEPLNAEAAQPQVQVQDYNGS